MFKFKFYVLSTVKKCILKICQKHIYSSLPSLQINEPILYIFTVFNKDVQASESFYINVSALKIRRSI